MATYRLQVNDDFTLRDVRGIVPYLAHLGITDLYLSPLFEARRGSTHGYDVTDPTRIRQSIGGISALRELAAETHRHHMGILLDIVPNHMAASVENPWWRDVLVNGRSSRYAHFFDIDWGTNVLPRRLALPILGSSLEGLIAAGEITLDTAAGEVVYFETRLPLAPGTIADDVLTTLARQHYVLVPWWTASEEMRYRRFFDITDLAGIRVEDDDVFRTTHSLLRDLAAEGIVTGIRIDHIDGLRDPAAYLRRLRDFVRDPAGGPVFTVVEKILERTESLPRDWACEGTTGYEFLTLATGLLIEPTGQREIDAFYRRISGDARQFSELAREKKLLVMERLFGGELKALAMAFGRLTGISYGTARRAIAEVTASMDVYRTYTSAPHVNPTDRGRVMAAAADASQRTEDAGLEDAIELVRAVALLEFDRDTDSCLDWVVRWQQFTGPVMAKGFEDTALYCHNALLAANDVGSDPANASLSAEELAAALRRRQSGAALSLNATATHDTKRGEDTRARIAVLSELPDDWRRRLRRWIREGDDWQHDMADDDDTVAPSADVQSLLYQTLLGVWPLTEVDSAFSDRIKAYMTKAVREAKEQTSWRRPDEDYEQALGAFIERLMAEFGREGVAEDVGMFAERIAPHGALNAIAQMLLKVTAPGIPDFYQGTELPAHTLVDPDNRAPIDFAVHRQRLADVIHLRDTPSPDAVRDLLVSWRDGRIRLLLTALALRFRATHRDLFEDGEVVALQVTGERADHAFAFARRRGERACISVLPRWTVELAEGASIDPARWGDTVLELPTELRCAWHNALTGETFAAAGAITLQSLFHSLPFALLEESQPIGG